MCQRVHCATMAAHQAAAARVNTIGPSRNDNAKWGDVAREAEVRSMAGHLAAVVERLWCVSTRDPAR
jgi:hypothetical protein